MDELTIIRGCKKLEAHCQRALVKKYSGILYTVCRRYSVDDFMAKEALQEGLIRIFKYIDRFDNSKGKFLQWMKRIVANESIKLLKKAKVKSTLDIDRLELPSFSLDALDNLHAEQLIALIQELPFGYREVFNLYEIEGYTHKEISKLMEISESTSRSQLSRAKKLLQQKISMIENLQLCRKNA
ncbi:MAG: sigma-70 family RNA polymerase sigma factor [Saprospiraceae bacterium]|nr:sigma-70 family RNA polymerase sigma factor [Saprospiraceae bacterium]